MNELKNLLINNWQLIVSVVVFILSFILQLIKKKPINSIITAIYCFAVQAINESEVCGLVNKGFKGVDKLHRALANVKANLVKSYPEINPDVYESLIIKTIEEILTTPQKKGGNIDAK